MSRSNPNENAVNPAKFFYEWSGDKAQFNYYDKEAKKKVYLDLPFTFIVLDVLSTCKGFDDATQMGYYSNEIRNTKTDILTIRNKKGVVFTGLYENAKEKLASKGLKYYQSVYVAVKEGKELILANIQLGGSGLSAFIEFAKENKITEIGVTVKDTVQKKKGKTIYFEPVYEVMKVADKTNDMAIELDKSLQEYLKEYLAKNASAAPAEVAEENQSNGLNTSSEPKKDAPKKAAANSIEEGNDISQPVFDPNSVDEDVF